MLYRLPHKLRTQLARPLGKHFIGNPLQTLPELKLWVSSKIKELDLSNKLAVSCVGDVITKTFLQDENLQPLVKYCFIDGGTQRESRIELSVPASFVKVSFLNPTGCISSEIFDFIKETMDNSSQYLVVIDGEEDLLVIPLILRLAEGIIFYGQPPLTDLEPPVPAGCVGLIITPALQKRIQKLFNQFEIIK